MVMKRLCVLLLGTFVIADEVNVTEKTEINTAASCDKSLYSEHDLKEIIDFVANSLSIEKKLNNTIQSEAVPVARKHVQWVESTVNRFSNRPEHLKHVLEDISVTRQHMEKSIIEIKKSLAKYTEFSNIYEEKFYRAEAILKKFVYYNQLCELNCGATEVEFRSALAGSASDRYCGTIAEIHETAQKHLETFTEEYIQRIHQQVLTADENNNEKVQTRLNDLKKIALKELGHTMYDILSLQDQYHHLKKDLKIFNNDYWLVALKTLNIQMDALLMKLETIVRYLAAHCQNCNRNRHTREPTVYRRKVDVVEKTNLLDSLIHNKIVEISKKIDTELHNIFNKLDENLDKPVMDNFFAEHLKPIQKEVTDLTRKEIEAFQELQISKLNIDMDLVKKLIANTKDLMNAMAEEYLAIVATVKDLVPT